ncbi:MAG: HEAT repeat protein [Phycisphaerales bacterium]|jgi:HEAT repeat protein
MKVRVMSASTVNPLAATLLGLVGLCAAVPTAVAQDQSAQEATRSNDQRLKDFIHFVRIANYDIAGAVGFELLDAGLSPTDFVDLVEGSREADRFERALVEAMRVPELEPLAAEMDRIFRSGKLARVRNPEEIARNIELLNGGLRQLKHGRERLLAAGEYAMPQLLETYLGNANPALRAQVKNLLVDMGRQAIGPMTEALAKLDASRQEQVVEVLGLIPYRTSLPYLVELHQSSSIESVRQATARAIGRLGGNPSADVATLYASLGEAFYTEPLELTSFPDEDIQLLWNYDPGLGLIMQSIDISVFHEAMAMRVSERALELEPRDAETVALWISSNFSRQTDQAAGYQNPAYPDTRRPASYYATAAGAEIGQRILRRAIDNGDTPLALQSITAIQKTAGSRAMVTNPVDGRFPLLEALGYANKRVQYEAAIGIGLAQPTQIFTGAERVVPILASAVRDAAARTAIVLSGTDREAYDRIRGLLEGEGYSVLPPAENGLDDLAAAIAGEPSIDLVVTLLPLDRTLDSIEAGRNQPKLSVTPVLALMTGAEIEPVRRQYLRDRSIEVRRVSINDSELIASASQAVEAASGGPIGLDEAAAFANRSLAILRDLAVAGSEVLSVNDSAGILIEVVETAGGARLLDVAEVLSYIGEPRTQAAITERVIASNDADSRLALLGLVADSGKRFGNLLDERLARRLVQMAGDQNDDLATAAAAALGSLGIPNEDLVPVILEDRSTRSAMAGRGQGG